MIPYEELDAKRKRAQELLTGPRWQIGSAVEVEARGLLADLRRFRDFRLLADLSEPLVRSHPEEPLLRRMQTQALIEIGYATAAIEVARAGLKRLPESHPEWGELQGLIGRAYKQIAMDAGDSMSTESVTALRQSLLAYAKPFRIDPGNTWHAINMVAMLAYAKRVGLRAPANLDPKVLAGQVRSCLIATPTAKRDRWWAATLAEASLALGSWEDVERYLKTYLLDPKVQAFEVGSTLRQFAQVWGLKDSVDPRLRGILQALRARLLQLPGAMLSLTAQDVKSQRQESAPINGQLEAILGNDGTRSFDWWKLGLERASSVAAIHAGINQRIGTGFLVPAKDFGRADASGRLLVTNFHVVNPRGAGGALRPEDALVAFEAVDVKRRHRIKEIVWSSPVEEHDACLLRLEELSADTAAIPIARGLPVVEGTAKVYVIGHPGGGELEFSFQDNALLDHEDPPHGVPAIVGVCRLHYRAPTEKGSSGSPVFNAAYWEAIALHHSGGSLSRLNGRAGTHSANEGVSLISIARAAASSA